MLIERVIVNQMILVAFQKYFLPDEIVMIAQVGVHECSALVYQ